MQYVKIIKFNPESKSNKIIVNIIVNSFHYRDIYSRDPKILDWAAAKADPLCLLNLLLFLDALNTPTALQHSMLHPLTGIGQSIF